MNSILPHRTVTFLFTDIEGSTKLLQKLGTDFERVLADHNFILRDSIKKFGGKEVDTAGDGFFIIFENAKDAVAAAKDIQTRIAEHTWKHDADVKVRMGIHTGEAAGGIETTYVGLDINRAARIGASGHGGQVLLSESSKVLIGDDLIDDIEIKDLGEFNLKDFEKPERIYQLVIRGLQSEFSPLKSSSYKKDNLPSHLTHLIGRDNELQKIKELLLKNETRLVTLTGPGGTGKTSLAYRVSESLISNFKDGVYAVLLASISDPSMTASEIAKAFGIVERPSKPILESLKEFLNEKEILLFLDNYEQIVSSADIVDQLLQHCNGLKILVTSRIVLHLKYEVEYFVPPLELPGLRAPHNIETLSQYSAVRLFIERAVSVKKDFTVTNENAPAIAEICVRLDGLPLAIELASARIKIFTPQMILSRLGSTLDILKSSSRSLPERHQTLRLAIQWSYELLSEDEKKFFRWMSVFTGGSTLDAIEDIFGRMQSPDMNIPDGIEALLDKSLLRRIDDEYDEPRFFMLETIRDFSSEHLSAEEKKEIEKLHADYYLNLAETAEPNLVKDDMQVWLNRLEYEQYNFREALNRAIEDDHSETAYRLGGALLRYWIIRGNLIEGSKVMTRILGMSSVDKISPERAKVLNGAGTLIHEISNYNDAVPYLEESLEIYRKLNDESGIASVLNNISWVNVHLGNADYAKQLCDESVALNKKLNNKRGVAVAINNLAWLSLQQGEFELSRSCSFESMQMKKELGDTRGVAFSKINYGWAEIMLGNYDNSEKLIEEGLEIVMELKDRQLSGWGNCIRSFLYHARGEYDKAEHSLNESLRTMKEIGNQWGTAFEITGLGHLMHHCGELKKGKELLERAVRLLNETGSRWGKYRSRLYLGLIYMDENDLDRAEELFKESVSLNLEIKNKNGLMLCFDALGEVAVLRKDYDKALKLFTCSGNLSKITRYVYSKCEKERLDKNIDLIKENFTQDIFDKTEKDLNEDDCIKIALE